MGNEKDDIAITEEMTGGVQYHEDRLLWRWTLGA